MFGENHTVSIDVQDLDNDTMMRMLADENLNEWAHDFAIQIETVRAVLQAAEEGKITLVPDEVVSAGANNPRGGRPVERYGTAAISDFLGANWTQRKVSRCTLALRELGDAAPVMGLQMVRSNAKT